MRKLIVSPGARAGFIKVAQQIRQNFGARRSKMYRDELVQVFDHICKQPESYPPFPNIDDFRLRKCVFQKKTIILFSYTDLEIQIVAIEDARTDWK